VVCSCGKSDRCESLMDAIEIKRVHDRYCGPACIEPIKGGAE
jgi:hypothetical protein